MNEISVQQDAAFLAHLEADGRHQLLQSHLLSVSESAGRLCAKLGIRAAGEAIGLLHDLGKYSKDFQQYLRRVALDNAAGQYDSERGTIDHSTAGAQKIWRALRQRGKIDGVVAEILSLCIASHHSGLIDCVAPEGVDKLSKRMAKVDSDSHCEEAWSQADHILTERSEAVLRDPELVLCVQKSIATLCHNNPNETILRFKIGLFVRVLFSCLIDADRTDTAGFSKPAAAVLRQDGDYVEWRVLARLLENALEQFPQSEPIDHIRRKVSEDCLAASERPKGIFTLTVPTGGGKTLASLRFALSHAAKHGMDRVIFVIPFTSIIDQNAEEVRKILEDEQEGVIPGSIVLEHHSNLAPSRQTWRNKILSENWDAPVVFTTSVQLLETLFGAGTRGARRMHQLANSVIVFDEIQT